MRKEIVVLLAILSLALIAGVSRVRGAQNLSITEYGHSSIIRTFETFKVWLVVVNNNTSGVSFSVEAFLDDGIYPTVITENGFVDGGGLQIVILNLIPKVSGNYTMEVRLSEGSSRYWVDSVSENITVGKGDVETKVDSLNDAMTKMTYVWISLGVLGITVISLAIACVWLALRKKEAEATVPKPNTPSHTQTQ